MNSLPNQWICLGPILGLTECFKERITESSLYDAVLTVTRR